VKSVKRDIEVLVVVRVTADDGNLTLFEAKKEAVAYIDNFLGTYPDGGPRSEMRGRLYSRAEGRHVIGEKTISVDRGS
jgi:hypothetical protein